MPPTHRVAAALAAATATLVTPSLAVVRPAAAQGITTGALAGRVTDDDTGEAIAGVTIAATAGRETVTAITEEDGTFLLTGLVPGTYVVSFFFGDLTVQRSGVQVAAQGTAQLHQRLDLDAAGGLFIPLDDKAPVIQRDTLIKTTVDRRMMDSLPMPGRAYTAALGITPGAHHDGVGQGFSGSSGLENIYVVDGVNTTGLRYGSVGSPILSDFVAQTEVITAGYNAEYGRSTGGVVNVVTRSGTNELEGVVFASVAPGALAAPSERAATQSSSIDVEADLDVATDLGFLLAGPVVKDRLWFVVGASPSYQRTTLSRTTKRKVDEDQNALPDVDPATGFDVFEDISTRRFHPWTAGVQAIAKLNYALAPEHQGQLGLVGGPSRGRTQGMYGLAETTAFDTERLTTDLSARWTSKFHDNRTELEAVVGWHRDHVGARNRHAPAREQPLELLRFGDLGEWSRLGFEDESTRLACDDGGDDPYPGITNCPDEGAGYRVGGGGTIVDDTEDRWSARLGVTRRLWARGMHELKAGVDAELNRLREPRVFTGGVFYENRSDLQLVEASRWIQVAPAGAMAEGFDRMCSYTPVGGMGDVELPCRFIGQGEEGSMIEGETVNWAAYLRDSWQVLPNLILDAGLRYEEQRLRYARFLRDDLDPNTGRPYGDDALALRGMWAPRVGVMWDWTREARSKAYAHWGRFYESIPMDINSRSFGGEVSYQQQFGWDDCGEPVDGFGGPSAAGCPDEGAGGEAIGVGGTLVAPGLEAQYLDEALAGVEYEVADDVKLGVSVQHRSLGRVIEDVSTDGAETYVIANPGEWSRDEERRLEAERDAATMAGDGAEVARVERLLRLYRGIRAFDRPRRDYSALQVTLSKRFSRALFMMASYTLSRTRGNFPGLVSYDNGQIDPNISSQYDLIELTANREGPLPQDRPHNLKVDGFYRFDLERQGVVTLGWRGRLASGVPRDALAPHPVYGVGESFLLPRGALGRTAMEHALDVHVGYARPLAGGMDLELFVDVFNLLDHQGQASVDEDYSYRTSSYPIAGGEYSDLVFAKAVTEDGLETRDPIARNAGFGQTAGRYAPLSARLGARLTF